MFQQRGSNAIGIGTNAGQYNTASGSIFIGSNAGSNNTFANALVLGNNPSYAITSANTFLVYSSTPAVPFLQGDMSNIYLGIGKKPTTTLDVSGTVIISKDLTVSSGTTTLSLANVTTMNISYLVVNTSLNAAGTSTLSSLVVQGTLSSSNVYVSNTLTLANSATITMNGTLSNNGTTTLGTTTVTGLNNIIWPTGTQTTGYVLTICSDSTRAVWQTPAAVSLAGWWNVAPTSSLNMNTQGITGLPSINGVMINFNSANERIGIGSNALSTSVTSTNIIALGHGAGNNTDGTNLIYLGSNPGGTYNGISNWFTVYSTTSNVPFLQGDMANMRLGIGKSPLAALDVSGSALISLNLNVSGLTTLSGTTVTTLSATSAYVSNALNVSGLATLSGLTVLNNISVGGTTTLGGTTITTLSASSAYVSNAFNVSGLATLSGLTVLNNISVGGLSTHGATTITTLSANSAYVSNAFNVSGLATLSGLTVQNSLSVGGLSTHGATTITTLSANSAYVSNAFSVSGLATLSGLTVQNSLSVSGITTLSTTTVNGLFTVCGQTNFTNLSFASLNSIQWTMPIPADNGSILTYDTTNVNKFKWSTFQNAGLANWSTNAAISTLSMNSFGITGITSFNNISAIFVSGSSQIGIGTNVLSNNTFSNIIAFGISAGAVGTSLTGVGPNNIFLGSNPGGSSNVSNSLVIYSQTAGTPLIYGDLSKNQVTIAGQTATGYTLNVNGSAQVTTLNVTGSSSFVSITATSLSNSGSTTLNGTVNIPGTNTLNVSGQATFSNVNILTVLSAYTVYVSNTFTVSGTTTLSGTVNIPGTNTLNVSGQATFFNANILTALSANTVYVSNTFTVSGTTTLSGTVNIPGTNPLNVSGLSTFSNANILTALSANTAYVSNAFGVGGITTLSKTIITNLSATNITISGSTSLSGVSITGTLGVSGATTLSGVTLNVLNNTPWPSTTGSGNQLLAMNAGGTAAVWTTPGAVDSVQWAVNPAIQAVDMSGFGIKNLTSINGLTTTISSTNNQISIGAGVLTNNTAANVIAFGSNAGSNAGSDSTRTNCIYLGANPGTSITSANTFIVYSTIGGIPTLQADMGQRSLGVGMVPSNALDIAGDARVSGKVNSIGNLAVGTYGIKTPSNYAINVVGSGTTTGMVTFYNSTTPIPYVGIGYDQTADGLAFRTNTGAGGTDLNGTAMFIARGGANSNFVGIGGTTAPAYALDVSGQINANTAVSTASLSVLTSTTLSGTLTLKSIASATYASTVLSYNSTTGAVNYSTLNLGTLGAADSNTMNANWVTSGGGLVTWNGLTQIVSGTARIIAIPVNNAMASSGYIDAAEGPWSIILGGWSAAYFVPNSIPSGTSATNGTIKVVSYPDIANQVSSNWIFICSRNDDVIPPMLKWGPGFINIPSGGIYNSQTGGTSWNVLGTATNIALGSNSSITGTTSIVIGSNNATSIVTANNVIAIGTNAGSNLPNLNNTIYIGSNAGYKPTTSNTLVVQSTSSTAPTLQADLANRYLGVGMVPSNALDVSGTIRASGPVISTLNVSGFTTGSTLALTSDTATTYYSLTTNSTAITLTLPVTAPPTGTYWVLKNNAAVNYTFTSTNGVFNGGSTTYYLQAGIGITLAYSGTLVGGSPAYYTF
jgi:hypothetical protein